MGLLSQTLQVCFGRGFFISKLSLGFSMCLLVMFLGRWQLLWSTSVNGDCLSSEDRVGVCVPLIKNSWIVFLAWFPTQVRL